jgi:hypothetical protein
MRISTPAIAVPNVSNQDDVDIWLSDGTSVTATRFFQAVGGVRGVRLMVRDASRNYQAPESSEQTDRQGQTLLSFAFACGKDTSGRVTSAAVILREDDVGALHDERFMARLAKVVPDAGAVRTLLEAIDREVSRRLDNRSKGRRDLHPPRSIVYGVVLALIATFLLLGAWLTGQR